MARHLNVLHLAIRTVNFDRLGRAIAAVNDDAPAFNLNALLHAHRQAFGRRSLALGRRLSARLCPLTFTLTADFVVLLDADLSVVVSIVPRFLLLLLQVANPLAGSF